MSQNQGHPLPAAVDHVVAPGLLGGRLLEHDDLRVAAGQGRVHHQGEGPRAVGGLRRQCQALLRAAGTYELDPLSLPGVEHDRGQRPVGGARLQEVAGSHQLQLGGGPVHLGSVDQQSGRPVAGGQGQDHPLRADGIQGGVQEDLLGIGGKLASHSISGCSSTARRKAARAPRRSSA